MATLKERIEARKQELQSPGNLQDRIAKRRAELAQANRNPDGTYGQPPDGAFMNQAGQMVDPEMQQAADRRVLDAYGRGSARALEYVQSAPLVGEWIDEGVAKVAPEAANRMNQVSDAFERQHPVQAGAIGVGGGIVNTLPALAAKPFQAAGNFIARGQGVLSQGVRAGAVAAPAAAVEGASMAAGRADPGQRGEAAVGGGAVGGALGFALGPAASLLGVGVGEAVNRFKKLDVSVISDEFGISPAAARIVKSHLANDDLDGLAARFSRLGDDAMLADAGPATRQALDTAMSMGGEALATARRPIQQRAQQAGARLRAVFDDVLGPAGGLKAETRKIAQRTAQARDAAYSRAYSQPTPMAGEAGQALEAALRRVDPRDMQEAVRKANAMMRDAGMENRKIIVSIDDAGNVVFSQPLSVAQLDYVARGLGEVADAGTDKVTGAMSGEAMRAGSQARAIRDVLKDSVDGYSRALKLGGDNIAEKNALLMGRRLLNQNTTFEDVITSLRGASSDVKAAARQGLRQNVEAVMDNARQTISNMEATGNFNADELSQAIAAVRNLSTSGNIKKMRVVLGADAKRLEFELQRVADALVLRSAVARGSATAIRRAGQEQMAAEVQPGLARSTLGNAGSPFEATRGVSQSLAGTDAQTLSRMSQEQAGEIARALTQIKGPEAERALAMVQRAMQGQPMRDAEAAFVARVIGGGALVGSNQLGQRAIGPR